MSRQPDTNFLRRFFTSPLFLVCTLVISFLFLFAFARNYVEDYNIRREILSLKQEVLALETKKIESLEILEYVMSDSFVEEKARKELNLKKPGENLVVIKNSLENKDIDANIAVEEKGLSKPVKWWYYFKHKSVPAESR